MFQKSKRFFSIAALFLSVLVFSGCSKPQVAPVEKKSMQTSSIPQPEEIAKQKTCPAGFVLVLGNPKYAMEDFCVMKYDAKCASVENPVQGIAPAVGSACSGSKDGKLEGVYKNNGKDCSCRGDKQVVSTATGFPITFIPAIGNGQDNAKAYCQNQGWHLLTNPEWMTIARDVEQVKENWCDKDGRNCGFDPGTAGKILVNGHNDSDNEISASDSARGALVASDDSQPCFGTTTDGTNVCGGKGSQKRTLQFGNGNVLWDFAGNVWHWVDGTIARKDQPKSKSKGVVDQGFIWSDFTPGSLPSVITENGRSPALGYDAFRPSDPTWNANNGVGRIYHFSGPADNNLTQYGYIRGGNWRHGYDSGAFCVHLSPPLDRANIDDVGFRCAVAPELK